MEATRRLLHALGLELDDRQAELIVWRLFWPSSLKANFLKVLKMAPDQPLRRVGF
jgi:hypothetical protein